MPVRDICRAGLDYFATGAAVVALPGCGAGAVTAAEPDAPGAIVVVGLPTGKAVCPDPAVGVGAATVDGCTCGNELDGGEAVGGGPSASKIGGGDAPAGAEGIFISWFAIDDGSTGADAADGGAVAPVTTGSGVPPAAVELFFVPSTVT